MELEGKKRKGMDQNMGKIIKQRKIKDRKGSREKKEERKWIREGWTGPDFDSRFGG